MNKKNRVRIDATPGRVLGWQESWGFFVQFDYADDSYRFRMTHEDALYLRRRLNACYVDVQPGVSDADKPGEEKDDADG